MYSLLQQVAYTFDAGPNACLFMLESEVPRFYSLVKHFFLSENVDSIIQGLPIPEHICNDVSIL